MIFYFDDIPRIIFSLHPFVSILDYRIQFVFNILKINIHVYYINYLIFIIIYMRLISSLQTNSLFEYINAI